MTYVSKIKIEKHDFYHVLIPLTCITFTP